MQSDRGQLFVLAALALAVMIIGIVVLLNGGLHTGNLSAQNAEPGVSEPREFVREAEIGANRVMEYSNYNNFSSYASLRRNFSIGVHNWSERAHQHRALSGEGVEISEVNVTNGSRIAQKKDNGQFLNASGTASWSLGTGLRGVRQFRMNITYDSLRNTTGLTTAKDYRTSNYFRVNLNPATSNSWRIYIYKNQPATSPDRIFLRVENQSGDLLPPCSTRVNTNGLATLHLTDGLIGRENCEQLTFLRDPATLFDINYTNGHGINGSYELFVNRRFQQLNDTDFSSPPPTLERALYSATISINYTSDEAKLRGNRTAIPDRRRFLDGEKPPKGITLVYEGLNATSGNGSDPRSLGGGSNAKALGAPNIDVTGDGSIDVPFIDASRNLKVINNSGNIETLVPSGDSSKPAKKKTVMTSGRWNGSGPSVFYANKDYDTLYRVDGSGSVSEVAQPGNGVQAVTGIGDIDDDGTEELTFIDGSQDLRYLDTDGTIQKVNGGGVGSNNGIGAGKAADFDDDGVVRVAIIDGSNHVKLVGSAESNTAITSTSAKKSPVTAADIDNDGNLEAVYIGKDDGNIKYVNDPLGSPTIKFLRDSDGNKISATDKLGVVS